MPSHLSISLLISGIVVTAVLVAVSRKKKGHKSKQEIPSISEIDMSWLDEFEEKEASKQSKKGKKKATTNSTKKATKKTVASEEKNADVPVLVSSSESEHDDGLDDIQLLAALQQKQRKVPQVTKKVALAIKPVVKPAVKPVFKQVEPEVTTKEMEPFTSTTQDVEPTPFKTKEATEVQEEPISHVEEPTLDAEWDSVPTKDELVLSSLRSRIESLGRSLESAEQAKSRAEKNLTAAQETCKRIETDLKERCQALGIRVMSLEGELNQVRANAQLVAKRLAHVEEVEMAEAKEEISRLTGILLETENRVSALNEERQALLARSRRAEEESALKTEEASRLKENVEALQPFRSKCITLESDLARVQQALGATERDLIGLRSQEAARAAENKRIIEEQSQKIVALEKTKTEAEQKEASLKTENDRIGKDLDVALGRINEAEAFVRELKSESDIVKGKLSEAESELAESKEKVSALEAEKKAVEAGLEAKRTETESLKASLVQSERAQSELRSQVDASAETFTSLNTTMAAKDESITALTGQVSTLESELASARSESSSALQAARSELENVKKRFAEHLVQNAGIKSRKEELAQENVRLNAELATLKAAVFGGVKVKTVPAGKAKAAPARVAQEEAPSKSETPLSR